MAQAIYENLQDDYTRRFVPDEVYNSVEEACEAIDFLISRYDSDDGPFVYSIITNDSGENIGYIQICKLEDGTMEKLICDMMQWANVTEAELEQRKIIPTEFGEELSWDYLCYVREHPLNWLGPTSILYGENDNLTSLETIKDFAEKQGASLTVMKGGEHWFHTEDEMRFLDEWIRSQK